MITVYLLSTVLLSTDLLSTDLLSTDLLSTDLLTYCLLTYCLLSTLCLRRRLHIMQHQREGEVPLRGIGVRVVGVRHVSPIFGGPGQTMETMC